MSPPLSASLIAAAVAFNLILLAPELTPVAPTNDGALHYPLVLRAISAMDHGESIVSHWNSTWVLGFPVFNYYAHLPHIAVALAHRLSGIDPLTLFNATRYILLSLFPAAMFIALRMFTFSQTAATFGALASSIISAHGLAGFELESYVWAGSGMYAQIWGMLLLPLAVAALVHFFRTASTGRGLALAVTLTAALLVSHTFYANMAVISAAALTFISSDVPFPKRLIRLTIALALAGLVVSYFLVPYALTSEWLNRSVWEARSKYDSYGHVWVLSKLFTGELLDGGRAPVLTLLTAVGAVSAARRRRAVDRIALALALAWLALYFGRPTWGLLYRLLPLNADLHAHRFIGGFHFGALMLIGLGAEALIEQTGKRWHPSLGVAAIVLLLLPAFAERTRYLQWNRGIVVRNHAALSAAQGDIDALITALRHEIHERPGRVYAGLPGTWGGPFRVGDVPVYALLSFYNVDALGYAYHAMSFGADVQYNFDDRNSRHYEVFNVALVVAPPSWQAPSFLQPAARTDRWSIYRAPPAGYFSVSTAPPLHAERKQDVYPAALAALNARHDLAIEAGQIESQEVTDSTYSARMTIREPSTLMFRMNYHPWWRATIDGESRAVSPIGPAFVGTPVRPGDRTVTMTYRPPPYKTWLLFFGWVVLAIVIGAQRRIARLIDSITS